jgi:hypothetical protein
VIVIVWLLDVPDGGDRYVGPLAEASFLVVQAIFLLTIASAGFCLAKAVGHLVAKRRQTTIDGTWLRNRG